MKRGEILLFILILAGFYLYSMQFSGFLQDDAYIFARYAQNIADGNGFVYNKGEHTEGATSLLWTLMAAIPAMFGAHIPTFLKYASLLSSIVWLSTFFMLCRQWLPKPYYWVFPVLIFASFPTLALWSQAGLETSFFGMLITSGFCLLEEWRKKGKKIHFILLCISSILLVLTRPEALPVIGLYVLFLIAFPNIEYRFYLFKFYLPLVTITFIALYTFRYFYFHDFVPNTYYAKGGGGIYLWRLGLGKFLHFLVEHGTVVWFVLCFPSFLIHGRLRIVLLIVPMWTIYYIISGGDILPEHRLLLPAVPFMILGTYYMFYHLKENYARKPNPALVFNMTLFVSTTIMVGVHTYYFWNNLRSYTDVIPALERAHGEIGRYLNRNMKSGETAILTDAGMTAYYAQDKHITDWLGLCDKRTAKIFYESGYNEWAMSYCYNDTERYRRKKACSDAMIAYFEELNPCYVVLNLYIPNTKKDTEKMEEFSKTNPDSLSDYILSNISFDGYFGVFSPSNNGRNYKPILVRQYNPYFWMVLAKRNEEIKKPF